MKVLIIGAGIAGICAARDLLQQGFDVQVIEARDRIGGRIAPAKNFSVPIDIGASWIHGVNGNPLTDIARQLNLQLDITDNPNLTGTGSLEIYNESGQIVDPNLQDALRRQFDFMLDSGRKMLDSQPHDISFEEMLHHSSKSPNSIEEHHFMEWLKSGMEGWDSSPLIDLSAKNHFWEHDEPLFNGGDGFICNGFYTMVEKLAGDIKERIFLEQVVKKVIQEKNCVKVVTSKSVFIGDYVICTLPLGVLKEGAIKWEPALPVWKQTAINRMGFGTMNKIILEFPDSFWNEKGDGLGFVSSKFRGEFGFFLNLLPLVKRPILMGFVAADFARHVETWTNEQIVARVMDILRKIYGKNRQIPDPVNFHITRWGSDPYARGSYSFMKVHSTPAHVIDLGNPVGRIHFAGEATAKYPGYTHGAFMSAKREVERIIKRSRNPEMNFHRIVVPSTTLVPVPTSKL